MTGVDLVDDNGDYPGGQFLDLLVDRVRMVAIAVEIVSGTSFSHSMAGPGKLLTRSVFERLRDYLLRRGLLRWNSEYSRKEGVSLTGKGGALVRGFASIVASEIPTLVAPADDGSSDASGQIAQEAGMIVISHQNLIKEELHLVFRSMGCVLACFNRMFLIAYSQFLSIGSV